MAATCCVVSFWGCSTVAPGWDADAIWSGYTTSYSTNSGYELKVVADMRTYDRPPSTTSGSRIATGEFRNR